MSGRRARERMRVRDQARLDLGRIWRGRAVLPSESSLARRWRTSRSTARLALVELAREHLVHLVPGRGWQAGPPAQEAGAVLVVERRNRVLSDGVRSALSAAGRPVHCEPALPSDWAEQEWSDLVLFNERGAPEAVAAAAAAHGTRLTVLGCPLQKPYDTVCADYAALSRELVERAQQRGHRRIAFVGVRSLHMENPAFAARLAGYRQAMLELDLPPLVALVESSSVQAPDFGLRFASWLDECETRGGRPTCCYLSGPRYARIIAHVCRERGLRVPADLALCGFGSSDEQQMDGVVDYRQYVGIVEPWPAVSLTAVGRIIAHQHSPVTLPPCCTLVPGSITDGDSIPQRSDT
ncbi:MAG: substrate-binding domain-containing protein [Planctomycetota bacterium]